MQRFPFRSLHTIVRVKTNLAFFVMQKGFSASASLNLQRRITAVRASLNAGVLYPVNPFISILLSFRCTVRIEQKINL